MIASSKERFTHLVLFALILNLFFAEYLNDRLNVIPRWATWGPEVISLILAALILLRFAVLKEFAFGIRYIILMAVFIIVFVVSSLINLSGSGAIIVGMRTYFKTLPVFLLPAVFNVDSDRLKKQLKFVLPLLLIQCPLAIYQRLFQFGLEANGDQIRGSLNTSGILSLVMICTIAVLNGLYLKKIIKLRQFIVLSLILFFPTTINETKVTLIYLPLAIVIPFIFVNEHKIYNKIRKVVTLMAVGGVFLSIFVPIYDYFMQPKWGYGIVDFITSGEAVKYVYSGAPYNENQNWRRGDRLYVAADSVSKDLGSFFFGYGPGNVSVSYFNEFQDKDVDPAANGSDQAVTNLIWEEGFIGLLAYMIFLVFIFRDARFLRKQSSFLGAFALGWCAVVLLIGLNLFYNNMLVANFISYTFWYLSGVVASQVYRVRHAEQLSRKQPLYRL
jgi:hypothetical protein